MSDININVEYKIKEPSEDKIIGKKILISEGCCNHYESRIYYENQLKSDMIKFIERVSR